jgi:hypothetical protein
MVNRLNFQNFIAKRWSKPSFITYSALGQNGRFGNQLWQIFSTIGLSKLHHLKPYFPHWQYSEYFSFPPDIFVHKLPNFSIESPSLARHLKSQAIYLQDYSLIKGLDLLIQDWMKPSPSMSILLDRDSRSYGLENRHAIHIRRGDYVSLSHYHSLPGTAWFENQLQSNSLIFTDDPEWCKQHFPGVDLYKGDEIASFNAMTRCESFTISASSYSWWAAYLSGSQKVVYPTPWAQVSLKKWNTDLFIPDYFEPRNINL